jgi:SNF2 family DNA or RNA helicase
MILKKHIQAFLNKERPDFRKYKRYSVEKLEELKDRLPIEPPIWDILNVDQKRCFIIGAKRRRFAFWADTGTGKTLLSIALIRYFRKLAAIDGRERPIFLVLVPTKLNKAEWARECRKWSPGLKTIVLKGTTVNKWDQINDDEYAVVIETYGGMVRLVSELTTIKRKGKADRRGLSLDKNAVKFLYNVFDGLILDESINIRVKKRNGSLMHRICLAISKVGDYCFALNGTPHGRDPTDLFGQMKVVDLGRTLGETLGLFRSVFFTESEGYWGGKKFKFNKKMSPELNRILASGSIRIKADESALPPCVTRKRLIDLPHDAVEIYRRTKAELMQARGNFMEMNNAFVRVRQISSGYVGYYEDELGKRAQYSFKSNPKLDYLMNDIEEIAPHSKIIVFHDFVFSGSMIERRLEQADIGFVRIHTSNMEPEEVLDRFDNDDDVRVFILNNAEAAGLNLQIAKYGLFFEAPVPVIQRKQARRRFERQHSMHKRVFLYDYVVKGTYDQRILDLHLEGEELFRAIIEGERDRGPRRVRIAA